MEIQCPSPSPWFHTWSPWFTSEPRSASCGPQFMELTCSKCLHWRSVLTAMGISSRSLQVMQSYWPLAFSSSLSSGNVPSCFCWLYDVPPPLMPIELPFCRTISTFKLKTSIFHDTLRDINTQVQHPNAPRVENIFPQSNFPLKWILILSAEPILYPPAQK